MPTNILNNLYTFIVSKGDGIVLFVKGIVKALVNRYRIPNLLNFILNKSKEEIFDNPANTNWDRLGLEKTWEYFTIVIILVFMKYFNDFINLFYSTKKDLAINSYEGTASLVNTVYKSEAIVRLIDQGTRAVCLVLIILLGRSIYKRWTAKA